MTETTDLQITENEQEITTLSIDDVKKYIAPSATDKELFLFMNICKSYGLNPFKREIHFVKYGNNPGSIIVGYETYLKRAERTGRLNGWDVKILDKGENTERAIITIYRKDQEHPFTWEVFRSEFDKQQSTWKAMPQFMLKKVAIAQGFRLAFPVEVGGMPYIPEELPNDSKDTSESLTVDQEEPEKDPPKRGRPPKTTEPPEESMEGSPRTTQQKNKLKNEFERLCANEDEQAAFAQHLIDLCEQVAYLEDKNKNMVQVISKADAKYFLDNIDDLHSNWKMQYEGIPAE